MHIRQQAIATAQVYIKRYYLRVELRRTNPYLVVTTALYLACKVEESPQHIRLMLTEARQLWQEYIGLDSSRIGECEFALISELDSQLIVHQPYRSVLAIRRELALADDDASLARSVINDSYLSDLPLLYSPHVIALVAILLALVLRPNPTQQGPPVAVNLAATQTALAQVQARRDGTYVPETKERQPDARIVRVQQFAAWLADGTVSIAAMVDCTQDIISFYECYEQYNEKLTRDQINRFLKARNHDSK